MLGYPFSTQKYFFASWLISLKLVLSEISGVEHRMHELDTLAHAPLFILCEVAPYLLPPTCRLL